ncbi:MAG TPA: HEAT repeat domain-containing protein, partial [Fimbriimonas sp.]|nr:HEAT repeat domain-containing protein [Fimbriimonas sp.]
GIGPPAAAFALRSYVRFADADNIRLLSEIVAAVGPDARKLLALEIQGSDPVRARNALRIACNAPGPGLAEVIVAALNRPGLQRIACEAAGLCEVKEAVQPLLPLTGSADKVLAREALIALARIGDENAISTATVLLGSKEWPMRKIATSLLAKFPEKAITAANELIARGDEKSKRIGIDLLAAVGSQDALARVRPLLSDSAPGVAIEALVALQGRFPEDLQPQLSTLCASPNAYVRRVAQGIQVDR